MTKQEQEDEDWITKHIRVEFRNGYRIYTGLPTKELKDEQNAGYVKES